MAGSSRSRPTSTSTTSSLMQDVPGAWPLRNSQDEAAQQSTLRSLSQAIHARRAEYVRPKHVRIKVGTWNVAAYKGTEKDVGGWFVGGKGVEEALAGLKVNDQSQLHRDEVPEQTGLEQREDVGAQEARYAQKQSTIPHGDPGSLPANEEIGLYMLGLQEVVDVSSFTEALRPYTDPTAANAWKDAMATALPEGYMLVAEQQLIGLLLLVYASPDLAGDVKSVSTTSVGTGIAGYMGNKGAVTARIVLGETTRLVFINCHLSAGADKAALERRNWDAAQIVNRTRFEPIANAMDLHQTTGEQIGDEDFAFWCGDLNYRLEGIPGDDVRRLLMLHTRNAYDLSQRSAQKIETEVENATTPVKTRVEQRASWSSNHSQATSSIETARTSTDSHASRASTVPTLIDDVAAHEDPTSLQTTIASLLPHDELRQQMRARKAFHDGWREGPIAFLPTYKYDAGSFGVFDSSEKKRAPSWCDRILYRTRRDRVLYEAKVKEEELARKRDEEMKANGTDAAGQDEEILYDYDPETDGADANDEYNEYDDIGENVVITKEGFEDEIELEYYTAHQRVLSSDHKPLDAVFKLKYECVVPELKAKVHAEVVKELDKEENETRPSVTVVVDEHRDNTEQSDDDPATFEGVWLGYVRYAHGKHRSLTVANTGRVPATFSFIERPVSAPAQSAGIAPKWVNLVINGSPAASSSKSTPAITLEPGETCSVELEVRIWDVHVSHDLNDGRLNLDDVLVLRVEGGRDHFIPIRGHWRPNSLGRSIDRLTRIPEGGIRKLQGQKPDGGKSPTSASSSNASSPTLTKFSSSALDSLPVSAAAPRMLPLLINSIAELSSQIVAEWDMTHSSATKIGSEDELPPWKRYPSWPFDEALWIERDTLEWQEAVGAVCDALDCDQLVDQSLPKELPRMQRLYVLAFLLSTFLRELPDGVITSDLWRQLSTYSAQVESTKEKPSLDEQRLSVQEILSQQPAHSICFTLLVSMIQRILQETAGAAKHEQPLSPSKRSGGTLRRLTTLGKLPTDTSLNEPSNAMARTFAELMIRPTLSGAERSKGVQIRRRTQILQLFLSPDDDLG